MLQHWLGDITEVYAMEGIKERPFAVDSTVQIIMKFSSGVVGSFLLSEYDSSFYLFDQSFWKLTVTTNFSATASPNSWECATGENPNFPVTGEPSLTIFGSQGTIDVPSL